ncbi:hypothetical protein Taro_014269 [Colocasia esculenta]|uniref:Secreted protein n=1 Tax=Colocasia esculenta TaxID=4460 RepID=A0A843UE71_COLES|nr:hypothetical protein [Colocasia esculenta]
MAVNWAIALRWQFVALTPCESFLSPHSSLSSLSPPTERSSPSSSSPPAADDRWWTRRQQRNALHWVSGDNARPSENPFRDFRLYMMEVANE